MQRVTLALAETLAPYATLFILENKYKFGKVQGKLLKYNLTSGKLKSGGGRGRATANCTPNPEGPTREKYQTLFLRHILNMLLTSDENTIVNNELNFPKRFSSIFTLSIRIFNLLQEFWAFNVAAKRSMCVTNLYSQAMNLCIPCSFLWGKEAVRQDWSHLQNDCHYLIDKAGGDCICKG